MNFNEPMGAPAIFEKQIEIKLLHPASTLESRIQVQERRMNAGIDVADWQWGKRIRQLGESFMVRMVVNEFRPLQMTILGTLVVLLTQFYEVGCRLFLWRIQHW
ncbi:MAG: hypothetical protein P8X79_17835 [Reinekea sp.]